MNIGKTIVKVVHGSRLYGLAGPSSDTDYKGIHLPSRDDCLLGSICRNSQQTEHTQNGKIEFESFALQEFIKLLVNSESVALDMLHSSDNDIIGECHPIWKELRSNRKLFYTKSMVGSLGYAKNMALKYGFRADRMAALEKVLIFLKSAQNKGVGKLYQCWDDLPTGEHIEFGNEERNNNVDKRFYEVAGKKLQATIDINYALEIIESSYNRYGDRVKAAKEMNGSDLKAISHSFRVGYQLLHIYQDGGFSYPLPETEFLRDVKFGKLDIQNDKLDIMLNDLINKVEELSKNSNYYKRVPKEIYEDFILKAYY